MNITEAEIQSTADRYKFSVSLGISAPNRDTFYLVYGYLLWNNQDLVDRGFVVERAEGAFNLTVKGIDYIDKDRWADWDTMARYLLVRGCRFL